MTARSRLSRVLAACCVLAGGAQLLPSRASAGAYSECGAGSESICGYTQVVVGCVYGIPCPEVEWRYYRFRDELNYCPLTGSCFEPY